MLPLGILVAAALGGLAAFAAGAWLRRRGVTAANALDGRQTEAYVVLVLLGAAAALLFQPTLRAMLPLPIVLWLQHLLWPAMGVLALSSAFLLLGLESGGWRDPARRRALLSGGIGLVAVSALVLSRSLPVASRLRDTVTPDGVVLQTSPSSCAAAAMATLARTVGLDPAMSERAMAARAGTTLLGTSTLGELRALRSIGSRAVFVRRLSADSLRLRRQPALLHVEEPVAGQRISHAVALIGYDEARGEFIIANPLYGIQRRTAAALDDYWLGEAVFLEGHRLAVQ